MNKDNLYYKNGAPVCLYKENRQIVYLADGDYTEYLMKDGKFTREAFCFEDHVLVSYCGEFEPDEKTGDLKGKIYARNDAGDLVENMTVIIDLKKNMEIVRDHTDQIVEISTLEPDNHATIVTRMYHPSGHVSTVQNFKTNIPHGLSLDYRDQEKSLQKGYLNNHPGQLESYTRYDNGVFIIEEAYDEDNLLIECKRGNDRDPDDILTEYYTYHDSGTYTVQFEKEDRIYYAAHKDGQDLLQEFYLDENQQTRLITMYEQEEFLHFYKGVSFSVTKMNYKNSSHYYPQAYDEDNMIASGALIEIREGDVYSAGQFINKDNNFLAHGECICRDGRVVQYNEGTEEHSQQMPIAQTKKDLLKRLSSLHPR